MCELYGIRYHVVTLIAVFLALGLGLLLGGTLGEKIIVKQQIQLLQRLEARYTQAKTDNSNLHRETAELKQQTQQLEQAMAQVGDHYAIDRLTGKKIAILQLEQTDISSLLTTLEEAGAQVTSTVQMTNPSLFGEEEPSEECKQKLGLPEDMDTRTRQQFLADTLAQELYEGRQGSLVPYLRQSNALTASGTLGQKPDVIIAVGGSTAENTSRLQNLDLPLLHALIHDGLTVVGVERSDVPQTGVAYYRDLGISTVDNIDQVTGRVALIDILSGTKGHFGNKKAAEALLPLSPTAKEVSTQ